MTSTPAYGVTIAQLTQRLGRKPTVNEWLIANGRKPVIKRGRKTRKRHEGRAILIDD